MLAAVVAAAVTWLLASSAQREAAIAVSAIALAWPCVLTVRTRGAWLFRGRTPYRELFAVLAGLVAVAALVSSVAGTQLLGRPFLVASAILVVGSAAVRVMAGRRMRALRRRGLAMVRTVVVGPAASASETVARLTAQGLATQGEHTFAVVGACVEGDGAVSSGSVPVLGTISPSAPGVDPLRDEAPILAVRAAVQRTRARAVCVAPGSEFTGDRLRALSWVLGELRVELITDLGLSDVAGHRVRLDGAGAATMLHVRQSRPTGLRLLAKVAIDKVLAGLMLLLLSPLLVTIAVAVRTTSAGPAIFRQTRVGRDGLFFTMLKFRTMRADAEQHRDELLESADGDGPMFKMRHDPRITGVGRVLRKYSFDELPQLVNVLRGEMSLVGPRPALPEEVATYDAVENRRLRAIPGLTGLWQVSGRSNLSWGETVRLDLRYVDNWSISEDARLLGRTAGAVARGTGAY